MLKYANGHAAKLGDWVRGIPENIGREVIGEIVQLEDHAPPNCIVAFLDKKEVSLHSHDSSSVVPMTVIVDAGQTKKKFHLSGNHQPADVSKLEIIWRDEPPEAFEASGASEATDPKSTVGAKQDGNNSATSSGAAASSGG